MPCVGLPVEEGQTAGSRVDGKAADLSGLHILRYCVEYVPLRVECQKGGIIVPGDDSFLPQSACFCIKAIDVDAFAIFLSVGCLHIACIPSLRVSW